MVLVGPSGCGKTTALRMVAGLEEITGGEIRIGDEVVNDLTPKERDIAMVFQSYALYPHMTVEENLAFGLKLRKLSKQEVTERVRRAAKILQIEEFLKRKPRALSGGQRQRVAMGRAIVREPAGVPDGRAALEPRRQATRSDERRDPPAAAPARRDDDLRHARPGRGDDDGRSRRGDERRAPAAGGHAAGALRPAGERVRRRLHRLPRDQPRRGASSSGRTAGSPSASASTGSRSTSTSPKTAQRLEGYVGRPVILGIRPEDSRTRASRPDAPADRRITATCELTEPLGSEVLVYVGTVRRCRLQRRNGRHRRGRGRPFGGGRRGDARGDAAFRPGEPQTRIAAAARSSSRSTRAGSTSSTRRRATLV